MVVDDIDLMGVMNMVPHIIVTANPCQDQDFGACGMEPISGTPASDPPSLSTIVAPVVGMIEEDVKSTESHVAFYASKLLTFKFGRRFLTSWQPHT